jgi:predicted membrane-bound spermidine synthase
MNNKGLRLFYIVFTASGFAGLIYESIWSHYLKLFLGHAAYAQALVLAVFMGGMAIGAFICSRYSGRLRKLLIGYVIVEIIVGICAVLFHPFYVRFIDVAFTTIIPALNAPLTVALFKWAAATLLILPQSILLGMTFPLMTAGLIRRYPHMSGSIIAMLYFTNSIGAAAGVLAAGFYFIGWVGLPGTLVIAGCINLLVAAVIWIEDKRSQQQGSEAIAIGSPSISGTPLRGIYVLFLLIALLTGLSSFVYEIGWIRMLSLVLGSSTHAFELMLSAFIMGIALGGLWIKRRIDGFNDPRHFLALVQVAMGVLALTTLPLYNNTFRAMAWVVTKLPRTETGYVLFNLSSHSIAMLIMLPAAFCAGMTLPLITTALLRMGIGERSIGAVYGFNTLGSILGVFAAIHLLMPLLGLKGMIILGAGIDIALGLGIAWWAMPSWRAPAAYSLAGVLALVLSLAFVHFDPNLLSSGVYRYGQSIIKDTDETLFLRDGKTATVSIAKSKNSLVIKTNGKPDAAIQVTGKGHALDEETMAIAGTLGAMFRPETRNVAIIGWGSGLTTHTVLANPAITSVDTIEIEPEMINAARMFGDRVRLAYDDPRSHRHIEDAKSYFSFHKKKYDLIISEPSNPWVSGVASLFTGEFYSRIRDYLKLYEIDLSLVASIMKSLSDNFSDYLVYATNWGDMLILASPLGAVGEPSPSVLAREGINAEMRRIDVAGISDINIRLIGNKRLLAPFFESYPITPNSDYAPVVDLYAVQSRFFEASASDLILNQTLQRLPFIQFLGKLQRNQDFHQVSYAPFPKSQNVHLAQSLYRYFVEGQLQWDHPDTPLSEQSVQNAIIAKHVVTMECSNAVLRQQWWKAMLNTISNIIPYLSPEQLAAFFRKIEGLPCQNNLIKPQKDFISLLKAVGQQDPDLMTKNSQSLLEQMGKSVMEPDLLEYILSVGILGNLAADRKEEAAVLWKKYGHLLPPKNAQSLSSLLLVAHLSPEQRR